MSTVSTHLAKPTPAQLAWHGLEMGMFIHWSPGTYQNTPSGCDDLSTPLNQINPHRLDTEQWVDVAQSMGAKYIVIVAKHIGGFCIWQTQTTEYGIRNTPWRGGKGDIVKDLSESCARRGVKLGVYLSPADRFNGVNVGGVCATPEKQKAYDQIYRRQLTELLTRYGEICEVWFDGSNVVEVGDILAAHAPNAMVFQSRHTTIRWVGNEDGIATYPAWNSVKREDATSGIATNRHGSPEGDVWLPLECDARFRANWFWTRDNEKTLKSLEHLLAMYYKSVGNGAVLLLNHTPDCTGVIPVADTIRAAEFGSEIRKRFEQPIALATGSGDCIELAFDAPRTVDHAIIMEDISQGERIRIYNIDGWDGSQWKTLCSGTAVGHKRIERFAPATVHKIRLHVLKSAATPIIKKLAAYYVGQPWNDVPLNVPSRSVKVGEWGEEIFYGIDCAKGANLNYDISDVIDDAGQFTLEFMQTSGQHGFEAAVTVEQYGTPYPQWVTRTDKPNVFNLSFPGVATDIQLKVLIRGIGGVESNGSIFITRNI